MYNFKREQVQFIGGETIYGHELLEQPVRLWRKANHTDEDGDDDYWTIITYADGKSHTVHGSDLNPHPEAPATNVEFITHLMEYAHTGPLMQMFIIDAIGKWADIIVDMSDEQKASFGGFINPEAWIATAKEAKETLDSRTSSAQRSTETV